MARMFTPVPNVVKVQIKGTSSDLNWANVLHFVYGGPPPTATSVTELAAAIAASYSDEILPVSDSDTTFEEVVVTDLSSADSNVGTAGTPGPGTATGGKLPASLAFLVSYSTTLRYRGGHPRNYLFVGVDTDLQDQSNWTADFATSVGDLWLTVLSSAIGTTFDGTPYTGQCAVSYRSGRVYREEPVVLPLTLETPLTGCASQRRRMRRRS